MNILYITIVFPKENEGDNLYTNLAEEIKKKHNITIIATDETGKTKLGEERGIETLRVQVKKIFNVSVVQKAISYITLPICIKKAIKKYLKNKKYDIVIYMAPPVTMGSVIKYIKKKFNCISYLMQKDIFPQNAVDIEIMKKNSLPYRYFRHLEKQLYKISDRIGCMSKGNIEYIVEHNGNVKNIREKVELFPNTITLTEDSNKNNISNTSKEDIITKYQIPRDKVIALYGGNFGKPQGIDFIIELLKASKESESIFWLFIGKGTEKQKLQNAIQENEITNAILLDYIPKQEYNQLLRIADVGLIFLDNRFTIPNIPSRLLSYLEYSIPVLAATDCNTDLANILQENNIGLWCESQNPKEFMQKLNYYIENPKERIQIGQVGRKYLEDNWTTEKSVKILEKAYNELRLGGNTKNEKIDIC